MCDLRVDPPRDRQPHEVHRRGRLRCRRAAGRTSPSRSRTPRIAALEVEASTSERLARVLRAAGCAAAARGRRGRSRGRRPAGRSGTPARVERFRRGTRSSGCGSAGSPRRRPRAGPARSPRGRSRPARRRSGSPRSGSAASRRCSAQLVVVEREEAADVGEAVLLRRHRACRRPGGTSRARCRRSPSVLSPGSRCLMNQAFSAKRQASRNERLRRTDRTARGRRAGSRARRAGRRRSCW